MNSADNVGGASYVARHWDTLPPHVREAIVTLVDASAAAAQAPTTPVDDPVAVERYRQQQQRLACPGCGEEPFLG